MVYKMKKIYFLLLMASMAWASSIQVEVKDEQPANNDMLGLRLRIVNNSGQQYNGVQIKYYLKKQPVDSLVVDEFYLNGFSAQLEQIDSENVVLNIGVPVLGTEFAPNADGISVGIHRFGWGSFHKTSLPGYPSGIFTEAPNYGVYVGNDLIAGTQLFVDPPEEIFDEPSENDVRLRFVGFRPETADSASAWVQLQNYGDSSVSLNGVKIKDASGSLYSLDSLTLGAKATLRICNGSVSNCAQDSVVKSIPSLSFGNVGELVLYHNSVPLDYIAWGDRGNFADSLNVENGVIDPDYFFRTSEAPVVGPVSIYRKGDFFRAIIDDATDSIISWNKFRQNMVDAPLTQFPYAEPFTLGDSSSVFKRNGEETMLTWLPAGGARSYVVTVLKASDKSVVLHEATDKTYYPIHLEEGEFLWIVEPKKFNVAEFEQGHTNENPNIPYSYYGSFKVFVLSDSHEPIKNLNVVPLAARKDSYMLDLKWGERIIDADWDKPHNSTGYIDQFGNRRFTDPKHIDYDIEESWRCWAVVTAELNHYYYGNLTQDEIKFYYNNFRLNNGQDILFSNPILDAFPHDDKGDGILDQVLLWALNINQSDVSYYGNAQLSHLENFGLKGIEDIFVDALLQEHPIVIFENGHFMVVDAVIKIDGAVFGTTDDVYVYRCHNVDNNGTINWRGIDPRGLGAAYVINKKRNIQERARRSLLYKDENHNRVMDPGEQYDADGDGLLDFDEYYRFGTYHYSYEYDANKDGKLDYEEYRQFAAAEQGINRDYDQDDIDDKTEIMSYTIRETYPGPTPAGRYYGVTKEVYADIDGDGWRAEKDPDSDNDGIGDGAEDVNQNGKKDGNETDVYVKDTYQEPSDVSSITLYALSELNYNDGVECYKNQDKTEYCNIASAAQEMNGNYAVKAGARSTVGDIYSKGTVLLRSNTHVKGGIVLTKSSSVDDIYMQNGATIGNGISKISSNEWNARFLPPDYNLADYTNQPGYELVVKTGMPVTRLNPGYYSFVKVEAEGILEIPPGTIYIGSIQLDPRSKVRFTNPGQETVMHVNGDFTWRAKLDHEEKDYRSIAQGFKLIQHVHGQRMYIDNMVAGNIVAPYSEVVIAQSRKLFYGTIFAKNISVHQYAKIYHVDFNPVPSNLVLSMGGI